MINLTSSGSNSVLPFFCLAKSNNANADLLSARKSLVF